MRVVKMSISMLINGRKWHNRRIWAAVKDLFFLQKTLREDELLYWRERILFAILSVGLALGFFVLVPTITMAIKEELWVLAILNTLVYLGALFLLIFRGINYKIRASITSLMTYGVGLHVIMSVGLLSGGPAWLFAFTVISAVLMGLRVAYMALTINGITLVIIGILLRAGQFGENYTLFTTPEKLIVAGFNFLLLNAMVAISVAVLVRSLQSVAKRAKTGADSLKRERTQLIEAKVKLKSEIDERKQAEELLKNSEQKYRTLVEEGFDGIFIHKGPEIIFANKIFHNMLGYDEGELLGLDYWLLYHPDYQEIIRERAQARMRGEMPPHRYEVRLQRKDGSWFYGEVSARAVMLDREPGVQVWARDVTRQKALESQLQQAQKMEAIGTLAGGIAHDFNNILSAVIGFTELSMDQVEKGTSLQEDLQEVLKASIRARDLVKQILTFSRQAEYEQKPIQVKLIVKEALKLLRASLPTTIEIRMNIQSDSLIMGDPTQIHQVMMNLCTNAQHAMQEKGGVLEVSLTDLELDLDYAVGYPDLNSGRYLQLTVSDTGYGMRPEVVEHIFDPFFTTKGPGEGTGLGLSVVHGIVKNHGGDIRAYSEPGKSTAFKVLFPVVERLKEAEHREERPVPVGTEHILFIDDEPSLAKMGHQILESLGYKVTTRTSGIEALELFKAQPDRFDLVITDMTMPHMPGEELSVKLIEIRPDIPIILCTGFSSRIDEEKVLAIGIRAFVMKPILRRTMAEVIRRVLDQDIEEE